MRKLHKLIIVVLCLVVNVDTAFSFTDTLAIPSQDTIFIQTDKNAGLYIQHTIQKSETLYSISKFYGLSLNDLYFFNPNIVDKNISIGQKITIPLPKKSIIRFQTDQVNRHSHYALCYKVKKGDTPYGIAKTRFKMPIDTLLERNAIITKQLDIGQILHIGFMKKAPIPPDFHNFKSNPEWTQERMEEMAYKKGDLDRKEYKEYGTAYCKHSLKAQVGHAVLHRTAKLRSYLTIKNPMTGKTVRARVLGRIPESVYTDDVKVVVSRQTARALGAKDQRFYVWLK